MEDFPTIIKLRNYGRQASIRVMKNITIKKTRIHVGMPKGCSRSYLAMNLTEPFRGNSSITIRTISTVNIWVEHVRLITEDN